MTDPRAPAGAPAALPSLALALCVRDEEEFLAGHLAYHHALGVSRAYVFLDRCRDASPRIARSFPWVEAIVRDRDPADRYMSVHQVKCLDLALRLARREGFAWLLHVDADEFARGDARPALLRRAAGLCHPGRSAVPTPAGHLPAMLAGIAPGTEMVVLRPRDAIPTPLPPGAPFWKLHYFQARGVLARPLLDPTAGVVRRLALPLGHDKGKSIVRTAADVQALSAHRWTRDQRRADPAPLPIPTERRGLHYHFVVVNARQWREKYRRFAEYPDHWVKGGPVRFPKQAWKEASARMSTAEAEAYYARWVAVAPHRLVRPLLLGEVVHDDFVERVLARAGLTGRGGGRP